jgi:hypothetical protein
MNDWSRGEILTLFTVVVGIIMLAVTGLMLQSRRQRNAVLAITAVVSVIFVLWLVRTLNKNDIAGLLPRDEPPQPSPSVSPAPSPLPSPPPKVSPTPVPAPTQEPALVPSPTARPAVTPTPVSQPRPSPKELPNTRPSGMVTLSFTLLDQSVPVTGARVEFTAGGFSSTAYTRNGRATASVPCGVPGMRINIEYEGMRNSAPIVRGLKCQQCHYEAGPIDMGVSGTQFLNVRCGGSHSDYY